jgi:hypothetical protein
MVGFRLGMVMEAIEVCVPTRRDRRRRCRSVVMSALRHQTPSEGKAPPGRRWLTDASRASPPSVSLAC